MGIFKSCYGVSLHGQKPLCVRAIRGLAGGIRHADASLPPPKDEKTAGCMDINGSLTIWLDTPFASKTKAGKILPSMLDVQLPFPLEECCFCFAQFRKRADKNISVLAVAARREAVQKRIGAYQSSGIDPVIIDHEGLALLDQSLAEIPSQPDSNRVLISLDSDRVAVIIGSENYFINAHSLQIQTGLEEAIRDGDIVNRIRRILRAELPPKQTTEWMFCGPLAKRQDIVNRLAPLRNEWPGPAAAHDSPESFLPRALAIRAISGEESRCNLRRNELTHPALLDQAQKRASNASFAFLLAGIILIAFNLAWQVIASTQFSNAKNRISGLCRELSPDRRITYGRETEEIQPVVQKRLEDFAPVINAFNQPLSIPLAGLINAAKKTDLSYSRLELSRDTILISGTTEDWDYCDQLLKYVRSLAYLAEVERHEAEDDNGVRFTLKGSKPETEKSRGPQ